jgi:hypothetical protein
VEKCTLTLTCRDREACSWIVAGIFGGGLHGGKASVTVGFELDIDIVVVRVNEIYSVCVR